MSVLHVRMIKYHMPAEMYDALELAALAHGGVGAGGMYADIEREQPLCAHGLLEFARGTQEWRLQQDLLDLGIRPFENDNAVNKYLRGKTGRISFTQWCIALGVLRQ